MPIPPRPKPSPNTVSARSRRPIRIGCGGLAWGREWQTVPVDAALLAELEKKTGDLDIVWPGEAPPDPEPELLPPTPEPAPEPPAPDVVQRDVKPVDATPSAAQGPAEAPVAHGEPEPAEAVAAPAEEPPAPQPQPEPPTPPPVEVGPYDARTAPAAALFGLALEALQTRGVRPPSQDADLGPGLTLEKLLDKLAVETKDLGGTPFWLSRPQRALVRATDGRSTAGALSPTTIKVPFAGAATLALTPEEHEYHFGSWRYLDPVEKPPTLIYLCSGIRSGKTYLAAIGVIKSALTCSTRRPLTEAEVAAGMEPDGPDGKVHMLQLGESIRVVFVTPKAEQSKKAFDYVMGAIVASPSLSRLIVKKTTERLHIRRPSDGVIVEFVMLAASPRGNNIRSGWLAGAIFDEAAFFEDDANDAAVNLRDNVTAAVSRLLPGAQVWLPSSPWSDDGYWHDERTKAMKRAALKGAASDALAFHSSSRRLNPALPEGMEESVDDPLERAREYDALPVSAGSNLMFPPAVLERAINKDRTVMDGNNILPPLPGATHYAGVDLGFTKNSSTIAIGRNQTRLVDGKFQEVTELAFYEEFIPPAKTPLVPGQVIRSFAASCNAYDCSSMQGDNSDTPTVLEHLAALGPTAPAYDVFKSTQERNAANYTLVKSRMASGLVDLPNDPRLVSQLKKVLCKHPPGGKMQVVLPKQGRAHADLVAAIVLMIVQAAEGATQAIGEYDARWDSYQPQMASAGL